MRADSCLNMQKNNMKWKINNPKEYFDYPREKS